jgi:hypothetical protein
MYEEILIVCVFVICTALWTIKEYRKQKTIREHVTVFPGGLTFKGRMQHEDRICGHNSAYFCIFINEFMNSEKLIGQTPSVEDVVNCIQTTHPLDKKEPAICALLAYQLYDTKTIVDVCKKTGVSISNINWYTHLLGNIGE